MLIRHTLLIILLFTTAPAWAQEDKVALLDSPSCWSQENAPGTRRVYSSKHEYNNDLDELLAAEPNFPGLISAFLAYGTYRDEAHYANQLRDKVAHCYVGCVLTLKVNKAAANYAAWYKEYKDLTDCNKKSLFEWDDIDATIVGIEGAIDLDPEAEARPQCESVCLQ